MGDRHTGFPKKKRRKIMRPKHEPGEFGPEQNYFADSQLFPVPRRIRIKQEFGETDDGCNQVEGHASLGTFTAARGLEGTKNDKAMNGPKAKPLAGNSTM